MNLYCIFPKQALPAFSHPNNLLGELQVPNDTAYQEVSRYISLKWSQLKINPVKLHYSAQSSRWLP